MLLDASQGAAAFWVIYGSRNVSLFETICLSRVLGSLSIIVVVDTSMHPKTPSHHFFRPISCEILIGSKVGSGTQFSGDWTVDDLTSQKLTSLLTPLRTRSVTCWWYFLSFHPLDWAQQFFSANHVQMLTDVAMRKPEGPKLILTVVNGTRSTSKNCNKGCLSMILLEVMPPLSCSCAWFHVLSPRSSCVQITPIEFFRWPLTFTEMPTHHDLLFLCSFSSLPIHTYVFDDALRQQIRSFYRVYLVRMPVQSP